MSDEAWRVVDTRGDVRTVIVRRLWESSNGPQSRWRIEAPGEMAWIDCDHDDTPREALCRWATWRVSEIRGPGELTTAEQCAALEARTAELSAALRATAPTCGDCVRLATHESSDGVAVSCDACRATRWRRRPDWRELPHAATLRSLDRAAERTEK